MQNMYDEILKAFTQVANHEYLKAHPFGYNVDGEIGYTVCFNCYGNEDVHMCEYPGLCKCLDAKCKLIRN